MAHLVLYGMLKSIENDYIYRQCFRRAVTDPRTSRRVALKKMPNVFQSVVAARRAFREIKMLCTFRHDNVIHFCSDEIRSLL